MPAMGLLLFLAILVSIGLVVAAAFGRITWVAAGVAVVAIIVVMVVFDPALRADLR